LELDHKFDKIYQDKISELTSSFYSPLFDPEAFHTGNYTEITQDFYKQKSPLRVGFIVDEIGNFRVEWREVR